MMILVVAILAIALLVSNLVWAFIIRDILKGQRDERWELRERIRDSEVMIHAPETRETQNELLAEGSQNEADFNIEADDEFEMVGKIDPLGAEGEDE